MMGRKLLISALAAVAISLAATGHAEEKTAHDSAASSPSEEAIAESLATLVFVPHDKGAPSVTEAGGVRALNLLPKVQLLAPRQMALSLSASPTLYWHITKAADGNLWVILESIDATIVDDPLLEVRVAGIDREGVFSVSLEDHGIILETGKRYVWSVVLSTGSSDQVARTYIEHRLDGDLAAALDGMPIRDRVVRLAAEGYWYDVIDALSAQIGSNAGSSWLAARARLLEEAGLLQAARFDRRS
jgi:hypothetical protein